jgi:MFS superfamily sulfate permease-like transporter
VKSGNTYTFTGDAAADENIAVEMLGGSTAFSQISGFRTQVTGLAGQNTSGSFWYDAIYTLSYLLNYLAKAAVILVPLLFLLIYRWYGRENRLQYPNT